MVLGSARGLTVALALLGLLGGTGCATPPPAPLVPASQLLEKGGSTVDARTLVAGAPLTVIVFFSRDCHCFAQHGDRLRALYAAYGPRGVQLVAVDPEVRASPEADAAEGARRGYPFPILVDRGAKLADALGAEYATYSVIVDARGDVRYRGGIDSDKSHLRDDATPYLRDALDDLLAGHAPRRPEAKTLGCSLEKW
jgi:hypothetical protein